MGITHSESNYKHARQAKFYHPHLALIASATESELAQYVEHLKRENQVLRARLPKRIHTTNEERKKLLEVGKASWAFWPKIDHPSVLQRFCNNTLEPETMKSIQHISRGAVLLLLFHEPAVSVQLKLLGVDELPSVTINDEVAKIHTQGLHVTDRHYLVTGRLEKRPKRALLLRFDRTDLSQYEFKDITPEVVDGQTLDHPGGFDVAPDGSFWIPLSTSHRKGPSKICRFEIPAKQPLATARCVSSFSVKDHIGAVCCLNDGTLYGANWDTIEVHAWKTDGKVVERVKQAERFAPADSRLAVQDWKHFGADSKTVIMGGLDNTKSPAAAVVRIADIKQGKVFKSMTLSSREDTKRPLTNEGMSVSGKTLYLLPEDIGKGAKVLKFAMDGDK